MIDRGTGPPPWLSTQAAPRLLWPFAMWHLLSLDAPTVAVLWTLFAARLTHTPLSPETSWAMGLAVWILYAGDRLMDTRHLARHQHAADEEMEARHALHHRHRGLFRGGIGVASIALAVLLPRLPVAAMRLYVTEGALLAGYLVLIHTSLRGSGGRSGPAGRIVPKELLVGPFFAAATFIPAVAANPALRTELLPCAALLAALCSLNCLFIYTWEHPPGEASEALPHPATAVALRHLPAVAWAVVAGGVALGLMDVRRVLSANVMFGLPCAVSAVLLLAVHSRRGAFSRLGLRVAADAALLTPLLLLPLLR